MVLVCLLPGGATVSAVTLFVMLPSAHENSCYRLSTLLLYLLRMFWSKRIVEERCIVQTCRKFTMVVVILGLFVLQCRKKLLSAVLRKG